LHHRDGPSRRRAHTLLLGWQVPLPPARARCAAWRALALARYLDDSDLCGQRSGGGSGMSGIAAWLDNWARAIRERDFAGARPLFAEDVMAFGSLSSAMTDRDTLEHDQW